MVHLDISTESPCVFFSQKWINIIFTCVKTRKTGSNHCASRFCWLKILIWLNEAPSCCFCQLHRAKKFFHKQPSVDNVSETSMTYESVPKSLSGAQVSQSPFQHQYRNHGCNTLWKCLLMYKNDYNNFVKLNLHQVEYTLYYIQISKTCHLLHLNPTIDIIWNLCGYRCLSLKDLMNSLQCC